MRARIYRACYVCQKSPKKLLWLLLPGKISLVSSYLLHDFTGTFCLWLRASSNDLSTELT